MKVPWEQNRCRYKDDTGRCTGIRLGNDGSCFAHTTMDQRELALAIFHAGADLNFARGVPLTEQLLGEILEQAPVEQGRPVLPNADFTLATLSGDASFNQVTFNGDTSFNQATFNGDVEFGGVPASSEKAQFVGPTARRERGFGATFKGDASFNQATFNGRAKFYGTTFGEQAQFSRATFNRRAGFSATFKGHAEFGEATFNGEASFWEANFEGDVGFGATTFNGDASFDRATFGGSSLFTAATFRRDSGFYDATFREEARLAFVTFGGNVEFRESAFERARELGPIFVRGTLSFDGAVFSENIDIEISANMLTCRKTKFRDVVNFRIRWADVNLEDADFAAACLVDRAPSRFEGFYDQRVFEGKVTVSFLCSNGFLQHGLSFQPPSHLVEAARIEGLDGEGEFMQEQLDELPEKLRRLHPGGQPRVVSVRRATVANLVLADVDLQACRFAAARRLDSLRIEGKHQFADRPSRWEPQLRWPPIFRWTVRRAIAEEHEWRYKHECGIRRKGWYPDECQPPARQDLEPLPAADIQNIYRDLRKGREDSKDEPGAADFYYGEMEMRRAAATPRSFEKLLLWLYWLVSGYGLRASRAFASLLVTILASGLLLHWCGFDPSEKDIDNLHEVLLFASQSTTSLFRAPEAALTFAGEVTNLVLRLMGPLFFGLALLSLRGRVRR